MISHCISCKGSQSIEVKNDNPVSDNYDDEDDEILTPPDPTNPDQVSEYISKYLRKKVLGKKADTGKNIVYF